MHILFSVKCHITIQIITTKLNASAFYNVSGPTNSHHVMYSIINKITFCLFIVC